MTRLPLALLAGLLLSTGCGDKDSSTAPCEYTGCDQLCVPEGAEWECTDTAAALDDCLGEGYQVCERQDDGECGWTMADQQGWDECVAGN